MPWGVAAAAVAAGGAAATSNKASKAQQAGVGAANALTQGMYDDTKARNDPFYYAGTEALSLLQQRLPRLTAGYDASKLTSEPGYQFGLDQSQQALERSLAARGRSSSGAAMKAATEYAQNYATSKLNDAWTRQQQGNQQEYNMLAGLVGTGQASANQTAAAGMQAASTMGNNILGGANAQAANYLNQGNILGNAVNQGVSLYNNRNRATAPGWSSAGGGSGTWLDGYGGGAATDGTSLLQGYADGGEVIPMRRPEPKVGTKAPARKGGGGGLSRDAVLAALNAADDEARMAQAPRVNPLNPRAVLAERERNAGLEFANGGEIPSNGAGGRTDNVPIMAAGGEHMIDAELVSMLGDGDNAAGQAMLEEFKQLVREKKRSAPASKPAQSLRKVA